MKVRMSRTGLWPWAVVTLLVACICPCVLSFKANEFKKCSDSNFCVRHRGVPGPQYQVMPKTVSVQKQRATAKIQNTASKTELDLTVTALASSIRVSLDERSSSPRFQVPGVLMDHVDKSSGSWTNSKKSATGISLELGTAALNIKFSPFQFDLTIDSTPVMVFNERQLFDWEHHRQKQEGDAPGLWEETFKSHTDTKPRGPEAISMDLSFPGVEHLYGLPQHADSFNLQSTRGDNISSEPYRLYNLDVFEYEVDSRFGLYGAIPMVVAHNTQRSIGAFWLNSAEMYIDVERAGGSTHTQWVAESGILDLFLLLGPEPKQVSQQYAALTGTVALPQMFALGYHQCRWNYRDEEDVAAVTAGFDANNIPYDVIWLDIEYTDGKRYFTWDKSHFPTPEKMQGQLADTGRKLVAIIDPHIKQDDKYYVYSEAKRLGHLVKNKDGNDFDGWCWPGSSAYVDGLSPKAMQWWADQYSLANWKHSTLNLYLWNDMNEPSVFNGPEVTMPKDNKHSGGWEHRDVHNVYGALLHEAASNGLIARGAKSYGKDGDRPFVLSRAFFAGSQRHGAIWTGDNAATWDHLRISVPMLLSISLAGMPFCGADVGGFFGNPGAELATRWWQLGAFYPFFRGHGHLDTKRREPWLYGEPWTSRVRAAIRQRYAMLPYLYTLFREANTDGVPVMRPMWYDMPQLTGSFSLDDQFMLGPSILVAPVLQEGAVARTAFLPPSQRWFDAHSGVEHMTAGRSEASFAVSLDTIPTWFRGGRVLPFKERPRRSSVSMQDDPYTLVVALDSKGCAEGDLYVDDGKSFAFERGVFAHRHFSMKGSAKADSAVLSSAAAAAGSFEGPNTIERIAVLGLPLGGAWTAELQSSSGQAQQLQAAFGSLWLRPSLPQVALVIRNPGMSAFSDWQISLKRK